mmetsp:Transcript_51752/g.109897  ORF Transcript_51752/g.109897 Transcript_51752/m.109897 type:complete len:209 (+) Transcript_51752:241-867(+)
MGDAVLGRWCLAGVGQVVGSKSSYPSSLHRHRSRPLQCQPRFCLHACWLDVHEAGLRDLGSRRHEGSQCQQGCEVSAQQLPHHRDDQWHHLANGDLRSWLERLGGRLRVCRPCEDDHGPPLHLFHQLLGPHGLLRGPAELLGEPLLPRLCGLCLGDFWRGIPQFPPRVRPGLPQRHHVVPLRPHQVAHPQLGGSWLGLRPRPHPQRCH